MRPLELAFPYAIDKLQADEGHRDGEKPVVVDDVPLEVQLLNPLQSQTHRGSQGLSSFICCLATGFGPTCLQLGWQWLGKWCDCKYVENESLSFRSPQKRGKIEDTLPGTGGKLVKWLCAGFLQCREYCWDWSHVKAMVQKVPQHGNRTVYAYAVPSSAAHECNSIPSSKASSFPVIIYSPTARW